MAERDKWQLVAWAVAAALIVFAAFRLVAPGGGARTPSRPVVSVGADARGAAKRNRSEGLFVHVAGAVRRPGLIRVARGARVAVALERAGGPLRKADLTGVNLAARLQDGQQVIVPIRGAVPTGLGGPDSASAVPGGGAATGAGAATAGGAPSISLATATIEQLDSLDGIGPTLARRIVEHRQRAGGFRSLGELRQVEGIGDKRFEALKAALRP